jgi:nicotinate-nucleotide adenylyltransferase
MTQRIGLYGGSFDPIHLGHLISARAIAEQLDLYRVILLPAAIPPHKQAVRLSAPEHRLAMLRLAIEDDPLFEVSEMELRRPGPSYTFDTVSHFRGQLGADAALFWIIGADSLPDLPGWYRIRDLVSAVSIVTACRPGASLPKLSDLASAVGDEHAAALLAQCVKTPQIDISATDIRCRAAAGRSVRYLVPDRVAAYLEMKGLYGDSLRSESGQR